MLVFKKCTEIFGVRLFINIIVYLQSTLYLERCIFRENICKTWEKNAPPRAFTATHLFSCTSFLVLTVLVLALFIFVKLPVVYYCKPV